MRKKKEDQTFNIIYWWIVLPNFQQINMIEEDFDAMVFLGPIQALSYIVAYLFNDG